VELVELVEATEGGCGDTITQPTGFDEEGVTLGKVSGMDKDETD
jgi:hypothetical protein